jgi:hypothetical protein
MSDNDSLTRYDGVSLYTHFSKLIDDRDEAMIAAYTDMQRRIDSIDECHEASRRRDADFYSKEQHDSYAQRIQEQMTEIRGEIIARTETPRYLWTSLIAAIFLVISGVWYFAETLTRLDISQKVVIETLRDHDAKLDHVHTAPTTPSFLVPRMDRH